MRLCLFEKGSNEYKHVKFQGKMIKDDFFGDFSLIGVLVCFKRGYQ